MVLGQNLFGKKTTPSAAESNDVPALAPLPEAPGYVVGIDLGTTHCVMAASPVFDQAQTSKEARPELYIQGILQTTAPGQVNSIANLPSFLYMPGQSMSETDLALPWAQTVAHLVGSLAREYTVTTPNRAIHSAKSWLSHQQFDPKDANLPLHAAEDVDKLSAVAVCTAYLSHLQANWDYQHPQTPLAEQSVVLTVPASFDPAARDLTAQAAKAVGLQQLTLLEEPQAATYAWIAQHQETWREQLQVGDQLLVVDVGGGTTDLSLIQVFEQAGELALERVAVGEHILLGGDNMDLSLAYQVSQQLQLAGTKLAPWQIQTMTQSCRQAKEALLADSELETMAVVVPGRGSALIGGSIRAELKQQTVIDTILDGFFPVVDISATPTRRTKAGLTQLGLDYAADAGITRYIAAFLSAHGDAESWAKPKAVLLNGGVFKSARITQRFIDQINAWRGEAGLDDARLLNGADLDRAVAQGAAYYGQVRQGRGLRIRGGLASTFYLGIESAMPAVPGMPTPLQAVCVGPFGLEEGQSAGRVPQQVFGLIVGEPVTFQFYHSLTRKHDQLGEMLDFWEDQELLELPNIQAEVPANERAPGTVVPVELEVSVTELGTLAVLAIPTDGSTSWPIELDVRESIR